MRRGRCRATYAFDSGANCSGRAAVRIRRFQSRLGRRATEHRLVGFYPELAPMALS